MLPEEAKAVAEHQRRRFNELVDVFDRPQPPEVMARLREIVASVELRPGAVVRACPASAPPTHLANDHANTRPPELNGRPG